MKKSKTKRNKFLLTGAFIIALFMLFSPLTVFADDPPPHGTSDAGVVPLQSGDDNPLSGPNADDHKIEPPPNAGSIDVPSGPSLDDLGTVDYESDGTFEVMYQVYGDGKLLSWQSESQVSEVVVKGGNGAYIYNYFDELGNYRALEWLVDGNRLYYYDSGLMAPLQEPGPPGGQDIPSGQSPPVKIQPAISNFGFFGTNGTGGANGGGNDGTNGGGNGGTNGGGNGGTNGGGNGGTNGGGNDGTNGGGNDGTNGGGNGGTGGEGDPGNGTVVSTGTTQAQSLTVAPERPLTALPATGGSILPMLALSLLLAGSGAVAIRKFKER